MKCVLCDREGLHEHHLIPKFIISMLNLDINPDLYRIYLCENHHINGITASWRKVQEALRKLQNSHDDWFQQQFNDEQWDVINEMRLNHTFIHDIDNCKECNKPLEKLWVNQLISNGVEEGERHHKRYQIMKNLKRFGYSDAEIRERIVEFNKNCKPPDQERTILYELKYFFKRCEQDGV